MSSKIDSAVILAAGRGTRMGAITQDVPKPMLRLNGKPMLELILERLETAGIERFLIVAGYGRELIQRHFRDWPRPISFVVQEPINGTGSAALLARDFTGQQPFLLTFGDIMCNPDEYVRCIGAANSNPAADAILAVKWVDDPWQGAAVYEENGRLTRIVEKPPKGSSTSHWNSAGLYCFRDTLFPYLVRLQPSPRNEYELTSAFEMMLNDGLELRISPIEGMWRDVGRPEDLVLPEEQQE